MTTKGKKHRATVLKGILAGVLLLSTVLLTVIWQGGNARANTAPDSIIENTATGNSAGHVKYLGAWRDCNNCGIDTGNNSYSYASHKNSTFIVRFHGVEARIWGVKEVHGGMAVVTVDGRSVAHIDTYAATKTSAVIYDTGVLGQTARDHIVTVTITGQKHHKADATLLSFDKADIYVAAPVVTLIRAIENTATGNGNWLVEYSGDWFLCGCGVDTGNNSYTYAYTQGAALTIRFHGVEAKIWGVKESAGGMVDVTVDGNSQGTIDNYAPTKTSAIIYDTGVLGQHDADHTVTLTINGQQNPDSAATVLSFDKADIYAYFDSATPTPTPTIPPTPTPTPAGSPTPTPTPYTGNAPGLSGAAAEDPYAFGDFRGTPVQVYETWNNFDTWAEMEAIQTVHLYYTGEGQPPFNVRFPGKLSFAQPMWAVGETADSCANGGDDQHYVNIATALKDAGFADAFIRLGWEQNGDWFRWHATSATATQWVQCFQHAYTAFKSVSPNFVIAWNPNKSTDMSGFDSRTTYPGDSYVDVIAVDWYDMYPNNPDQATWDANYNMTENGGSPVGIGAYIAFADSHGKPLAFPEWGLNTENSFDNPFYITKMADTFDALRAQGKLYWESYFNLAPDPNSPCVFEITGGCNPNASAVYVDRF